MAYQGLEAHRCNEMTETNTDKIIENRDSTYGGYGNICDVTQAIYQPLIRLRPDLAAYEIEGIHMIVHKCARALCGDWNHLDNFVDMIGYAKLIKREYMIDSVFAKPIIKSMFLSTKPSTAWLHDLFYANDLTDKKTYVQRERIIRIIQCLQCYMTDRCIDEFDVLIRLAELTIIEIEESNNGS